MVSTTGYLADTHERDLDFQILQSQDEHSSIQCYMLFKYQISKQYPIHVQHSQFFPFLYEMSYKK
jgi:hypothetical protein